MQEPKPVRLSYRESPMLKIDLSDDAIRFISRREPKHQRQIKARIQALLEDPAPSDSKALKGIREPFLRVDVGEYRVIYWTDSETLHVPIVGKRNDDEVYRRLKRK